MKIKIKQNVNHTMATIQDLALKTLKEKWYRKSTVYVFDFCAFCIDAKKSGLRLECWNCQLPNGREYVCNFLETIIRKPPLFNKTRVCELTEQDFQFVKGKIEALIVYGAKSKNV